MKKSIFAPFRGEIEGQLNIKGTQLVWEKPDGTETPITKMVGVALCRYLPVPIRGQEFINENFDDEGNFSVDGLGGEE